jgi:hypothetical protein
MVRSAITAGARSGDNRPEADCAERAPVRRTGRTDVATRRAVDE